MHNGLQEVSVSSARRRSGWLALLAILLVAALLRLPGLSAAPPGLHQDEAANAWNAWCLLKTGRDQAGVAWPIFYTRAMGENRSALFLYLLLPFQALGGLNVWTTRLPAAVSGILTVILLYAVVRRLFGRPTGFVAAALLALNPTHIQMSRWGHEASIVPLLVLLPLAAWLWAGFPLSNDKELKPRPWRALLAGLLTGACCYGYPAVRMFVPVFLGISVIVTWRGWWQIIHTRRGMAAVASLALGVGLTFGPLAYKHVTEPEIIAKRGQATWIWSADDPLPANLGRVFERYTAHFHAEFLFDTGDADEIAWTAGYGFLPWYYLPLLATGLVLLVMQTWHSRAARVILVGALLFPVGDSLNWHISLHAFRSSAGLIPLIILAAAGLARALTYVCEHRLRGWLLALIASLGGLVVPETGSFLWDYFHERPRQHTVYRGTAGDLLAACDWLRPRMAETDAVICTTLDMNQPYFIVLVAMEHDPRVWFSQPRVMHHDGAWDVYSRVGKFHFLPEHECVAKLEQLREAGQPLRVVLILRMTQFADMQPTHRIRNPDGRAALLIYELEL
ncbi:MAG: glycosyltransferase family 39 protein [Planctomycetota bacterium]